MKKPYTQDVRDKAVDAVKNGMTFMEAADYVGASSSSVYQWCVAEGVTSTRPPRKIYTSAEVKQALDIFIEKGSTEASKITGCSRNAILGWAREQDVRYKPKIAPKGYIPEETPPEEKIEPNTCQRCPLGGLCITTCIRGILPEPLY